jgi:hypothetical protein
MDEPIELTVFRRRLGRTCEKDHLEKIFVAEQNLDHAMIGQIRSRQQRRAKVRLRMKSHAHLTD